MVTGVSFSAENAGTAGSSQWNQSAAAHYLDDRELWWQGWAPAQRDHGTSCVSCHTVLPYALSRPALRSSLNEQPSVAERTMMERVEKRVALWNEVEPFYKDSAAGPDKSAESRATESVVNSLILSSTDAHQGRLRDVTRKAFDAAWALQLKEGPAAGAWKWQVFHLAPWESAESQYQGAAFMALAVGLAPDDYRNDKSIAGNLQSLRSYLLREYPNQPLLNRIVLLWASAKLPGLMPSQEQEALVASILQKQGQDGGWCIAKLGSWQREDHTELDTTSDGYATGVTVVALEENGLPQARESIKKGIAWLQTNQDKSQGAWHTSSLNKRRKPDSDVGRFMSDAATGYAVLALEMNSQ